MFNLFNFNDNSSSQTVQGIIRWVIMGFFAYALWHSYVNPPPPKPNTSQSQQHAENLKDKDCNKNKFPLFSIPLIPAYNLAVKTEDLKAGSGIPATCGQEAKLHYEYLDQKGDVLEKGDKTTRIGSGKVLRGIELGLIGMRPGGERKIMTPLMAVADAKGDLSLSLKDKLTAAKISLMDISPAIPQSAFPLRALNTVFGNGRQVNCGDKVYASISLWKVDGTELFSSGDHPLVFTLGGSEVPYGIELGMSQMMEEGERTVILPPGYNKPLHDDASASGLLPSLPENEMIVAKIELLHIGDYPAKKPIVSPPAHPAGPVQKQ